MTRIIWYAIVFSLIGVFLISNIHAYAQQPNPTTLNNVLKNLCRLSPNMAECKTIPAEYEKTGFFLIHSPTICALTPQDQNFPNLAQKTLSETQGAVNDWVNSLGSPFEVNYKEIPLNGISNWDYSQCDISITYEPQPADQANPIEPMGVTQYDFNNHKTSIVVYYKLVDYKGASTTSGKYIIRSMTPYFTDSIASDAQLSYTLRHELGHAFGLGHYLPYDAESTDWNAGKSISTLPSLMIAQIGPIGYDQFNQIRVKSDDVNELKSLYGRNGFNSVILPQTSSPVSQTMIPSKPVQLPSMNVTSNQQSTLKIIPSWVKNNAYYWSIGNIGNGDFVKGIQYLIQQKIITIPVTAQGNNSQSAIPNWIKKDAKLWARGDLTDDDFTKAIQFLINDGIIRAS